MPTDTSNIMGIVKQLVINVKLGIKALGSVLVAMVAMSFHLGTV